jgi:hypothetical protein
MIQKPIKTPKDELQTILKFHHQLNINHDTIIFWYIKFSFIDMFILIKDELNTLILAFRHCIWPLKMDFEIL